MNICSQGTNRPTRSPGGGLPALKTAVSPLTRAEGPLLMSGGGPKVSRISAAGGETRGRTTGSVGVVVDRGGGRLVRVSGDDPGADGSSLQIGRALGLGAAPGKAAGDQDSPGQAEAGHRSRLTA